MKASLSISIVTYAPDFGVVRETLRTLDAALRHAQASGTLGEARVQLIDNGPGDRHAVTLGELAQSLKAEIVTGHGNVGYGAGHNLALHSSSAQFHLVLNPDVELAPEAIDEALRYMEAHPNVVILAPDARNPSGEPLYLCKRYPSVLALLLRGFAPAALRNLFKSSLERYEMRDLPRDRPSTGVTLVSGSFMFCRRAAIAEIGGFSDVFFLYFEDYDLSLRAAQRGELAWVPSVRIVHRGGQAARKGWHHRRLFAASAVKFFNRHGWKWA